MHVPAVLRAMLPPQALALRKLQRAYDLGLITPVDLATHQMDSPASWWADRVHVASSKSAHVAYHHSGLEHMTLQVLLNTMCAGQPA